MTRSAQRAAVCLPKRIRRCTCDLSSSLCRAPSSLCSKSAYQSECQPPLPSRGPAAIMCPLFPHVFVCLFPHVLCVYSPDVCVFISPCVCVCISPCVCVFISHVFVCLFPMCLCVYFPMCCNIMDNVEKPVQSHTPSLRCSRSLVPVDTRCRAASDCGRRTFHTGTQKPQKSMKHW